MVSPSCEMFQFHKGAIKSVPETVSRRGNETGFNSIKVRLKAHCSVNLKLNQSGFNSIKVRLKAVRAIGGVLDFQVVSIP